MAVWLLTVAAGWAARDVEVLSEDCEIFGKRVHGTLRHERVAGPRDSVAAVDEHRPDVGLGGQRSNGMRPRPPDRLEQRVASREERTRVVLRSNLDNGPDRSDNERAGEWRRHVQEPVPK